MHGNMNVKLESRRKDSTSG